MKTTAFPAPAGPLRAVLCLGAFVAGRAAAEPPPPAEPAAPPAQEIVITASRAPRGLQAEPATVHRLDTRALTGAQGVRTLPELLEGVPSVMVQKTGYGQGSPYLRGFTGFRTVCLVDGIRLNNSVFRDGPNQYWNTVDPLALDHAELVLGPASVLYGSDAVGGTLNALTAAPPEWDGAPAWERALYVRGATAERSVLGRAQIGGRPSEDFGFTGGVSLKEFGDLRGGREVGRQRKTGYPEQDADLRLDWHPGEDSTITLAHQSVRQDEVWRTHRTIYGTDWKGLARGDDQVHYYDQERDLTYLAGTVGELGGAVDRVRWTLSRHAQNEELFRVRKDGRSDVQGFDVTTWGASVQLESDTALGDWVYGAEYYYDEVASETRKYKADGSLDRIEIQGPVADDASYASLGLFAQNTIHLFDGALDLVPGVRHTHSRADANRVKDPVGGGVMRVDGDWDATVGSLRALVPLTADRTHVLFASVAQGFRAPNLSDLTRLDIARSTEIETAAPDLDPERFVAYEAGLKSRFEQLTTQVSIYHTTMDDLILRTPTGRVVDELDEVTKRNSGRGYVQGAELAARYDFTKQWAVWMAASWMDGEVDAYPTSDADSKRRQYLTRLMPPTGRAGVRWQTLDGRYWCELSGDAAGKADHLSADDRRDTQRIPPGGTPAYAIAHLRAGTRVTTDLDVNVAVENLFDTDYRIHGSGVNEPGRNFILTTSYRF